MIVEFVNKSQGGWLMFGHYACPGAAPVPPPLTRAAGRAFRPSTCTKRASTPPSMGSTAACIWLLLCAARVSSIHSALQAVGWQAGGESTSKSGSQVMTCTAALQRHWSIPPLSAPATWQQHAGLTALKPALPTTRQPHTRHPT